MVEMEINVLSWLLDITFAGINKNTPGGRVILNP